MATWTTPKTWADGALVAADLNSIRDNLEWIKDALLAHGIDSDSTLGVLKSASYAVSAYRDSNQSLTAGSNTTIQLPSEYKDTHAMHSTSANTQRLTVPSGGGGDFLCGYTLEFAANASGDRTGLLAVNGVAVDWGELTQPAASASNTTTLSTSTLWYDATAGDYLTLIGRQGSGGSLNVVYANLWMVRLFAA